MTLLIFNKATRAIRKTPTDPSNWNNVAIHVKCNAGGVFDVSGRSSIIPVGSFGPSSDTYIGDELAISTLGNGYALIPYKSQLNLTAATWTMEMRIRHCGDGCLVANDTYGVNHDLSVGIVGGGTQLQISTNWASTKYFTPAFPALQQGQEYHIALVRKNSILTVYLNGALVGTSNIAFTSVTGQYYTLGCVSWNRPQWFANTYFTDFRFVVGEAIYTEPFSPPASIPYGG